MSEPSAAPSPAFVQQLNFQARDASNESAALQAALALGFLEHLPAVGTAAPVSLEALAGRTGVNPRGLRSVIEPLVALGFVHLEEGRGYALPASTADFLRDAAFVARLHEARRWWHVAAKLPEAVRTGAAVEWSGGTWDLLGWYRALFLAAPVPAPSEAARDFHDRLARAGLRTQALVT
ncbi:methyltransferase, partial [Pyxidicoccus sp. 3LG]